jgi:motility quorum-sensing regulator/GCU-specific mRNA interferase toxin
MRPVEKRTPHYDLARVQADVARLGAAAFTKSAMDGGRTMGLTTAEMLAVIVSLTRRDFYKSMTTYADHRVWQDVYRASTPVRKDAYIKITLRDAAPVIQFKER